MDNFTYFHLCDHRIKKPATEGEVVTIAVTAGSDVIDTIIHGAIVLELYEIRALEYDTDDIEIADFYYDNDKKEQTYDDVDPEDSYYDQKEAFVIDYSKYYGYGQKVSEPLPHSFFEPILHNRVRWLVKAPKRYLVSAKVKFTHTQYSTYARSECPVCAGKGWFIDILNKDGQFEQPSGIVKIAQRFVKDFMTELGTQMFDEEYGTNVKKSVMGVFNDDDALFNEILMAVSETEDRYLTDQQNMILELENDEILSSVFVENIKRVPERLTTILIRIRFVTETDDQVFQLGI